MSAETTPIARFDRTADRLTIVLRDSEVTTRDEARPGVILDYDAEGRLAAIEILGTGDRASQGPAEAPTVDGAPARPETLARFDALRGFAGPGPTTDEIMAMSRGDE
jgi:uncharacterized protein YuzE